NKNKELISQEIKDEDEVSDSSVIVAKVFNIMQTVICYKEQKFKVKSFFEELEFLKNLLKEYKYVY
ncbi:805_t:CDS:1, partial [Cetraspora pellucida]